MYDLAAAQGDTNSIVNLYPIENGLLCSSISACVSLAL